MKKYSKAELQELGIKIANELKVEVLIATEDAQFFEVKDKSAAELHARENKLAFYKLEFIEAVNLEPKKLNQEETIEAIEACESLEDLEVYATDTRKKVVKAFETMKQMLSEDAAIAEAKAQAEAEKGNKE